MATVEELRKGVTRQNDPEWNGIVDALIAASEARGAATYKAFIENNDTRRAAIATLAVQSQRAYEAGKREGHAEGAAEGAEEMVNQIKSNGGQYTQKGDAVMSDYLIQCPGLAARAGVDLFIVPASVLAPTKKGEK